MTTRANRRQSKRAALSFVGAIAAMLLVITFASFSHAATVHRIDVAFTIQPDGTVDVMEEWHITIDEENKFGLFRRFLPIWETDVSEIEIESVLRNGETEPWTLSTVGSPFSLVVGTQYRNSLRENEQIYAFNYRLSDFIVREKGHEYLLWAVSRTLLDFGIGKDIDVHASIVAPSGTTIRRAFARLSDSTKPASGDVYVEGAVAESDNHPTADIQVGNDAADFEHIVLQVTFPPNSFATESRFSRLERTLFHSHHIAGPLLIAAVLAYFAFAWHQTRRRMRPSDDKAGVPLSPAFMRFLSIGRYDNVAIAATVRGLIAKRLLRVDTFEDGSMQIRRGLEHEARAAATGDEQAFLNRLFPGNSTTVPLNDGATDRFNDAGLALRSHIQSKFYRLTLRENRTWVLFGLALTGGGIVLMTQYGPSVEFALDFALPLWFLLVAVGALGDVLFNQFMAIVSGSRLGLLVRTLGILFAFVVVLASFYYCLHTTAELVGQVVTLACVLALVLSALLFWAQNRSVRPRGDARRQIREMRARLARAAREPGGVVGTATVVEDLIPYAVALDRSGKWSRVLEERLRALGKIGPAVDVKPWYDGGSVNLVDYGRVAHYLPRR